MDLWALDDLNYAYFGSWIGLKLNGSFRLRLNAAWDGIFGGNIKKSMKIIKNIFNTKNYIISLDKFHVKRIF